MTPPPLTLPPSPPPFPPPPPLPPPPPPSPPLPFTPSPPPPPPPLPPSPPPSPYPACPQVKCSQYWPDVEGMVYANIAVTCSSVVTQADFVTRTFNIKNVYASNVKADE